MGLANAGLLRTPLRAAARPSAALSMGCSLPHGLQSSRRTASDFRAVSELPWVCGPGPALAVPMPAVLLSANARPTASYAVACYAQHGHVQRRLPPSPPAAASSSRPLWLHRPLWLVADPPPFPPTCSAVQSSLYCHAEPLLHPPAQVRPGLPQVPHLRQHPRPYPQVRHQHLPPLLPREGRRDRL